NGSVPNGSSAMTAIRPYSAAVMSVRMYNPASTPMIAPIATTGPATASSKPMRPPTMPIERPSITACTRLLWRPYQSGILSDAYMAYPADKQNQAQYTQPGPCEQAENSPHFVRHGIIDHLDLMFTCRNRDGGECSVSAYCAGWRAVKCGLPAGIIR